MVQDKLEGGHATRQCYMYKTTAERHVTKQKIEAAMSGTKVFFGSEAWTASAAVVPPPRSHAAPRRASRIGQTLQGSFSAVSKRNVARKYAFESSRRDLHNAPLCTALKSHFF